MSLPHSISLAQAIQMTSLFKTEIDKIIADPFKTQNLIPTSETFNRAIFDAILAEPGCVSVRIYSGMSSDLKVHAVIVGVDASGADILPSTMELSTTAGVPVIGEDSQFCPPNCGPKSTLNP